MLFVDFPNAQASNVTQTSPRDYRTPQPYYDDFKAFVPWFDMASYGRLHIDLDPVFKWYRMPKASNLWRMDYRSTDPLRRLSHDGQGEYVAAAVAAADADIDFSGYDLIYVIPARNQTSIASSPELNNYSHHIVVDGNDLGNGDTMGSDMFGYGYKLLNHETGHAFSLVEGYNAGSGPSYMGQWDLMGTINGSAPDFIAWNKWKLGWLNDDEVDCVASDGVTEHTLTANAAAPDGTGQEARRDPDGPEHDARRRAARAGRRRLARGRQHRALLRVRRRAALHGRHDEAQRPRRLQRARRDARVYGLGMQRREVDLDAGQRPAPRAEPFRGAVARRHVRRDIDERRRHARVVEGNPPGHQDRRRARRRHRAVHHDAHR